MKRRKSIRKETIKKWILAIDSEHDMPDDIVAINFGLFEGPYSMYCIGSKTYDEDDSDWACMEDYVPVHKYCPSLGIPESVGYETVLDEIVELLRQIIKETPQLKFWKVSHITVGFDDGDLICIK